VIKGGGRRKVWSIVYSGCGMNEREKDKEGIRVRQTEKECKRDAKLNDGCEGWMSCMKQGEECGDGSVGEGEGRVFFSKVELGVAVHGVHEEFLFFKTDGRGPDKGEELCGGEKTKGRADPLDGLGLFVCLVACRQKAEGETTRRRRGGKQT